MIGKEPEFNMEPLQDKIEWLEKEITGTRRKQKSPTDMATINMVSALRDALKATREAQELIVKMEELSRRAHLFVTSWTRELKSE